jgi:hypothetical protein
MRSLLENEAIAIYGSLARGDYDILSDRDVLFISDDRIKRSYMQSNFKLNGWSCTTYSWKRLEFATINKILFIQHLKREAKIIYDPQELLYNILEKFSPKENYKHELENSKQLIRILENIPDCGVGRLWALDVLMVSFRSMSIAILANEGIYKFSFNGMLKSLLDIGVIIRSDIEPLSKLRYYKTAYRQRNLLATPSSKTLIDLIEVVNKRFNIGIHPRFEKGRKIVEDELSRVSGENYEKWYFNLRRIELTLFFLIPKLKDNLIEMNQKRNKLFNMIQTPAEYGWNFSLGLKGLKKDLRELALSSYIN